MSNKQSKTIDTPQQDVAPESTIEQEVSVTPEVNEAVVHEAPTEVLNESAALARELNITLHRDAQTGKPIGPSTPAMRAALARRAQNAPMVLPKSDIEAMVIDVHGPKVMADPNIKLLVTTLTEYLKRMGPNSAVTEVRGGELQAKLASVYDVVLSLNPELSQIGLEIIVSVVKQNIQGAFKQTAAFRFANTMPLNKELSLRFQLLTTLFINLASGTKKKDLAKVINVHQLHEYLSDRTAKANLSEFIN